MSGEQEDQIAPRAAVASMAMQAAGMSGSTAATRSPKPTPWDSSHAATRATASDSAPKESSMRWPRSLRKMSAG